MGEKEKFSGFSLLLSNLSMDSEDRARDLFTENADRLMKVEILLHYLSWRFGVGERRFLWGEYGDEKRARARL